MVIKMTTLKLYDLDAYLSEFSATVVSCEKRDNGYAVELDRTAFFPEAGGQTADSGVIGDAAVLDVQIVNEEEIYHITDKPLTVGSEVECKINFPERFKKMQIHSGEHIVSGVMHSLFGLSNVGFHLGESEVTLDFNEVLTREQLDTAEKLANEIIYKNVPIRCYYPSSDELSLLEYRSKKELECAVRIVEIEGYDRCACCAPHVAHTGEVGIIKLTHFEKLRGGTRITLLCASDAVNDYREKYRNISEISALLCAKQNETAEAVQKLLNDKAELNSRFVALNKEYLALKAESIEKSDEAYIMFTENMSINDMRAFANLVIVKRPAVFAFSKTDKGYNYLCAGSNMKALLETLSTLPGGGGGSDKMIQGSLTANEAQIKEILSHYIDK